MTEELKRGHYRNRQGQLVKVYDIVDSDTPAGRWAVVARFDDEGKATLNLCHLNGRYGGGENEHHFDILLETWESMDKRSILDIRRTGVVKDEPREDAWEITKAMLRK